MSRHVAASLNSSLAQLGLSQTDLALKAGLAPAQINRYTHGAKLGEENLAKICAALDEPHDAALVVAYLRDMLPAALHGKALIHPNDTAKVGEAPPTVAEELHEAIDRLNEDEQKDLLYLLNRANANPPVWAIIARSAAFLRG